MKNLALPRIQAMTPYAAPSEGRSGYDGLLLDFSERTTPPPKAAIQALKQFVRDQKLQLYPEYSGLPAKIAKYVGVEPGQVMLTNGSDQAIDVIFRTFVDAGEEVIIPSPTFSMFEQSAGIVGGKVSAPLLEGNTLAFPLQKVKKLLKKRPKLLVVVNPNNPTGGLVSLEAIRDMAVSALDTIIFVDEAYFEFTGVTAAGLIGECPNVVVSRTFSKAWGLAGLRVGYILANEQYVGEMLKVRGPFDVNRAAYCAASAVLDDQNDMRQYVDEVMGRAKPFTERFFRQNDIDYFPSSANFILFRPGDAADVAAALRRGGVLVRPQDKPGIYGSLRLTIGTVEQMQHFADIYQTKVMKRKTRKYAFLDRDGTLIFEPQDTFQVDSLDKLRILDGVIESLKALNARGYTLVMVSNQDGLGTSSFPKDAFEAPQQEMIRTLAKSGVVFEEIFICPHFEQVGCDCRKPKTGLLDEFLRKNPANLSESFVCGDRASDAKLAANLGVQYLPAKLNGNLKETLKEVVC